MTFRMTFRMIFRMTFRMTFRTDDVVRVEFEWGRFRFVWWRPPPWKWQMWGWPKIVEPGGGPSPALVVWNWWFQWYASTAKVARWHAAEHERLKDVPGYLPEEEASR